MGAHRQLVPPARARNRRGDPPAGRCRAAQASRAGKQWLLARGLRTWYALADGTQRTPAGYLFPCYCPLPPHAVMSHWSVWQDIWAGIAASSPHQDAEDRYDIARLEAQPAGTTAWRFLPSFVPIAEDLAGADTWGPRALVTAMLADLVEGLHAGRPVGRWQPVVDHGRLSWNVAAHP